MKNTKQHDNIQDHMFQFLTIARTLHKSQVKNKRIFHLKHYTS